MAQLVEIPRALVGMLRQRDSAICKRGYCRLIESIERFATENTLSAKDRGSSLGAVLTVKAASSMYQCAETESIAFGLGRLAPMAAHRCI
jgi:hypothetical protein